MLRLFTNFLYKRFRNLFKTSVIKKCASKMNTIEIESFMKKDEKSSKNFVGALPCNHLPRKLNMGQSVIINLCELSKTEIKKKFKNCHWLSVCNLGSILEIYDSSGLPTHLINPYVKKFIGNHKKPYVYNDRRCQSDESKNCGPFSIVYICLRNRGFQRGDIINIYNYQTLEYNDRIANYIMEKIASKKV